MPVHQRSEEAVESHGAKERLVASSSPDLVWRAQISGLLKELTAEVLALTEVVLAMNEKLAAMEKETAQ